MLRELEETSPTAPSVGLVHDYLLVLRGAERAFATLASCWPEAPIYTLLYNPAVMAERFGHRDVRTSRLQQTRASQQGFRRLLPFYGPAARSLPVQHHDLVVSSSTAFAHRVRPRAGGVHVCYCHSPFRYAWHERADAILGMPAPLRPALRALLWHHRRADVRQARRVTRFVASSRLGQQRIADFWGRDAPIVHPPVEVERFSVGEPQDYFLIVGELVRHKRVHVALEAARRAERRIVVVGSGPEEPRLRAEYGDHAEFLGRVDDARLAELYAGALALVYANVEEFGIAAVEAQASGRPVLGIAAGGALETVIDGVSGTLVPPDDRSALAEAMREVDFRAFSPEAARASAARFSTEVFRQRFADAVAAAARPVLGHDAAGALMAAATAPSVRETAPLA